MRAMAAFDESNNLSNSKCPSPELNESSKSDRSTKNPVRGEKLTFNYLRTKEKLAQDCKSRSGGSRRNVERRGARVSREKHGESYE